jgi:two-component system OmpR family response regulator
VRILLVEDDSKIGPYLEKGLKEGGYSVDLARDGEDGLSFSKTHSYDLVVLDLMLPKVDGLSLLTKLRSQGHRMPVLILSAKRSVDDRIKGLQSGGDDYLIKPFSFSELLARVQALLRRANIQTNTAEPTRLSGGGITLDLLSRSVTRDGKPIELQPKEFALLEYLLRNPERPVSRTSIGEHVWDIHFDAESNVIDVYVNTLRRKVDRPFKTGLIQTVVGVGYVLRHD